MITAVEEHRLQNRQRGGSAASGPQFSVPSFAPMLDMLSAAPVPTGPVCAVGTPPPAAAPSPGLDLSGYLGRSVGSGQCVALVRAAEPNLGPSAGWSAGASVQGNVSLRPGTPIATFDGANRYANATDGSSHAAIYLGQSARGVTVLDQWAGSGAAVRTIPWDNPSGVPANTGAAFRVVKAG